MNKKETLDQLTILEEELKNKQVQECEVYSRVVGYFRPTKQYNVGKQLEFATRVNFDTVPKKVV